MNLAHITAADVEKAKKVAKPVEEEKKQPPQKYKVVKYLEEAETENSSSSWLEEIKETD